MKTAISPRARRAVTLAATAAATLSLSACMVTNPQSTTLRYAPADGVEVDGDQLVARDLLLVSHGNGAPAVVSGTLVNRGTEAMDVTVSVLGEQVSEVSIAPRSSVRLDGGGPDGDGERTRIEALEAPAGQHVELRIVGGNDTLTAQAPILLPHGTYEKFADDAGGEVEDHHPDAADH